MGVGIAGMLLGLAVAQAQAWDIKDVRIDDPLEPYAKKVRKVAMWGRGGGGLGFGPSSCYRIEQGDELDKRCSLGTTFAGLRGILRVEFVSGRAAAIVVEELPADQFSTVEAALREKFGAPASDRTEMLGNAMGAEFSSRVVQWESPAGEMLIARERAGSIDRSEVRLVAGDYEDRVRHITDRRQSKAASDL